MSFESIIIIATFILPGALSKILLKRYANIYEEESGYMELADYITNSFIVVILNITFIYILNILNFTNISFENYSSIEDLTRNFDTNTELEFLFKYIILTFFSTFVSSTLIYGWVKYLKPKVLSKVTKNNKIYGYTLWESIFHSTNLDFDLRECPLVEVIKDGEVIALGRVHSINGNARKKPEFLLFECDEMKAYLESDKNSEDEDKIFKKYNTYCSIEDKIVVKVYKMDKYKAYVQNFNQQSN